MGNRRIRDIKRSYHCSIIGTCLDLDEVRALLAKSFNEEFTDCSDYILHGMAVGGAGEQSRFSNRLNEKLNTKFRTDLYLASKIKSSIELEKFWMESLESGRIAGPYWAVMSHNECGEELCNRAFGDVHMLSHLAGAGERTRIAEIGVKDRRIEELESTTAVLRSNLFDADCKIKKLEKEKLEILERLEAMENIPASVSSDHEEPNRELEKYKRKQGVLEKRNEALQLKVFGLLEELNLQKEHCSLIHSYRSDSQRGSCESGISAVPPDLEGKKVLLVGGRPSMVPHCKSVVETMNGRFIYHDGGREQSRLTLRDLALSADIVICALDCVSHDASRCVKRICGDAQQVIMMKNSGLSSFAKELKRAV